MRQYILWTIVILTSCSTKRETTSETSENDTTSNRQTLIDAETESDQTPVTNIDFPLDSLLKFDSEEQLKHIFGDDIKRSTGYYPEGMGEYQNTLLFPGTKNQVEFVWLDDSVNFSGLAYIQLSGTRTGWKTKEGVTLGTKLKELEKLNEKSFTFWGFGWDYSGMVDWKDGHLHERKIAVSLRYPDKKFPTEYLEQLTGEKVIESTSEIAQKTNPFVSEITMRR